MNARLALAALLALHAAAWTADAPADAAPAPAPAPAATLSYAFAVGQKQGYLSEVEQLVGWNSAGDRLEYRTLIQWRWFLIVKSVAGDRAVVRAIQTRCRAEMTGPGTARRVDSADDTTFDDPLLGHLGAFAAKGLFLDLTIDRRTGAVSDVAGGDGFVAEIDRRAPAAFAGDTPPQHAAAVAAYSSASLAAWWTQLLALPNAAPQAVPLPAPLTGSLERAWQGDAWTLSLPKDAKQVAATFGTGASAIAATVHDLGGKGKLVLKDGLPELSEGEATFAVDATALTQPVTQHHRLRWRLARLALEVKDEAGR